MISLLGNMGFKVSEEPAQFGFLNPIALRTTKTLWSFGCSECNRVTSKVQFSSGAGCLFMSEDRFYHDVACIYVPC